MSPIVGERGIASALDRILKQPVEERAAGVSAPEQLEKLPPQIPTVKRNWVQVARNQRQVTPQIQKSSRNWVAIAKQQAPPPLTEGIPSEEIPEENNEAIAKKWWEFWKGETGEGTFPEWYDSLDLAGKHSVEEFRKNPNARTLLTALQASPALGMVTPIGGFPGKIPKIPKKGKIIPKAVTPVTPEVTPITGEIPIKPEVPIKPPIEPPIGKALSPEDDVLNAFGKRIASPKTTEEFATQKELWATERATRANRFAELLQQEQAKGTGAEESIRRATAAFKGEFPKVSTGLDLPPEFKDAAYAKIIKVIQTDATIPEAKKAFEIAGTKTALDNALMGKPIPDIAGIKGGSAKSRLLRIFNDNPIIKEIIEKPEAVQKRLLENALPPEKLDFDTMNYLRNVPTKPFGMARLGEVYTPPSAVTVAREAYKGQGYQELLIDLAKNPSTVAMPPEQAIMRFKQFTNLPPSQRQKILTTLGKIGVNAIDALGIPKSLKFGYDVSMPLRQGALIGARHPVAWVKMWKPMFQALKSEEIALKLNREMLTDPEIMRAVQKMGLDLYGVEKGLGYMARPESMASRIAEKYIPGVRPSARSAAVAMNKLMTDVGKNNYRILEKMGAGEEEYKAMGSLINQLAGRGTLPKWAQGNVADILNKLLTSPRYVVSRFEWPTKLLSSSRIVRQESASTLVAWSGVATSLIGLAYANGVRVEFDPRSADAYKIRIGDKRIDFWLGYAQIIRLLAQLATQQRKTETGEIIPITRAQALGRWAQSKESPGMGALVTLLSGENYVGEKLDLKTMAGIGKFAKETFMPAALEEMIDAYVQEGTGGAGISGLGLAGVSVSTYSPRELMKWKESVSASLGREITIEEEANLRPDFDKMRESWLTYQNIKSPAGKENWLEKYPLEDALMYFWGKKTTLSTPKARDEFRALLEETGLPEDAFPIREKVEPVETKKMKEDEIFDSLLTLMPSYMADYVIQNKDEWQTKNVPNLIKTMEDIKSSDQKLLDKYRLMTLGEDDRFRENYRRKNPEIDAALAFSGKTSSLITSQAKTLLKQKADRLGIPYDSIPALQPKKKAGGSKKSPIVKKRGYVNP